MSPQAEFGYRGEALRCHACKAVADATERYAKADPAGLFIGVKKIKTR